MFTIKFNKDIMEKKDRADELLLKVIRLENELKKAKIEAAAWRWTANEMLAKLQEGYPGDAEEAYYAEAELPSDLERPDYRY